ncbi:hypothetical protein BQ8420_20245 [Nocardiopsis sp. JB363]|nr:hypothetical protein BQ8420_20245 [Nocardiopsis sp. JB363]
MVDAGLIPYVHPLRLDTVQRRLVGHAEGMRAVGHGGNGNAPESLFAPGFQAADRRGNVIRASVASGARAHAALHGTAPA